MKEGTKEHMGGGAREHGLEGGREQARGILEAGSWCARAAVNAVLLHCEQLQPELAGSGLHTWHFHEEGKRRREGEDKEGKDKRRKRRREEEDK